MYFLHLPGAVICLTTETFAALFDHDVVGEHRRDLVPAPFGIECV